MREIFLIARREYLAYVGAWGFWVSLASAPLLLALFVMGPLMAGRAEPARVMTVIAEDAVAGEAIVAAFAARSADALPRYTFVPPPATTPQAIAPHLTGAAEPPLFAAFFVRGTGEALTLDYWSTNLTDTAPSEIAARALSQRMRGDALALRGLDAAETAHIGALEPKLAQFDPRAKAGASAVTSRERAPFIVAGAFALLLWSAVMGVANMLLTGVIEEKSNKILDQLLTSATPLQILIGKLCGVAAVSFTLFGFWGLIGGAGMSLVSNGQTGLAADLAAAAGDPSLLGMFAVLFLGGYLIFGAVFLGLGALCDTLQEAQSLLGPVVMVLTLPILLLGPAFPNPHAPRVVGASWFPLFTPFVMMMRAPAGLSLAEIAGAFALLAVTVGVVLTLAARVFHAGVVNQANAASLRRRLLARGS
jgi:ABC-2 type transport system permease protein